MEAKGRVLGVQFEALFTDSLYERIGHYAVDLAMQLKRTMVESGFQCVIDSPTNQQFFSMPNSVIDQLSQSVGFELWGARGEQQSVVRFVTSWSTSQHEIDSLKSLIESLH